MLVKFIIILLSLVLVTSGSSIEWEKFKNDFNKKYKSPSEETIRKAIFQRNLNKMREFQQSNPNATFQIGINHLTDRLIEELVSPVQFHAEPRSRIRAKSRLSPIFPDSLDWRTKDVIGPVINQGALGETNAIVAVEVIETLHAIQTGKLVRGSFARVSDCCPQTVDVFECIAKMGGICSAGDYPGPTGQCVPDKCKPFAHFDKIMHLKTPNEDTMVAWIQNSTLYVGIDASQFSFQMYQAGIYKDAACSKTSVDHVLQLVGYGKTSTGDLYWICRNSWGATWGERGYIRILRGQNVCGIASYVTQVA